MNLLSQAIRNGHYPKKLVVNSQESFRILDHFYVTKGFCPVEELIKKRYSSYYYAFYTTKKGKNKRCLVLTKE